MILLSAVPSAQVKCSNLENAANAAIKPAATCITKALKGTVVRLGGLSPQEAAESIV